MQLAGKDGSVIVAGTATRDCENKLLGEKGTPLTSFSLAINAHKEEAKYVECKAFGKVSALAKNIKKGDPVAALGFVDSREYNGKTYTDLNCQFVIAGNNESYGFAPVKIDDIVEYDDNSFDLPF